MNDPEATPSIGENTNTAAGYYGDTDNPNKAGGNDE